MSLAEGVSTNRDECNDVERRLVPLEAQSSVLSTEEIVSAA